MTDNPEIMTQLYQNLEFSEPFSAALDLQSSARILTFFWMLNLQSYEADPIVIWAWLTDHLALILQYSRADATESGLASS